MVKAFFLLYLHVAHSLHPPATIGLRGPLFTDAIGRLGVFVDTLTVYEAGWIESIVISESHRYDP